MENFNIRNKAVITQKLAHGQKIQLTFSPEKTDIVPRSSMWVLEYSTDSTSPFCSRLGQFKSCLDCARFKVIDEEKSLYECSGVPVKIDYNEMRNWLSDAAEAGCMVEVF